MTAQTITLVPLAQLVRAPENARADTAHDPAEIATLGMSITALGKLLDPLKGYQDGDKVAIWDGGRRLAALQAFVTVPDFLADGVPVILTTREDAALASLATFIREDMHPVDQFLAWNAQFDAGHSEDMIAMACGVSRKEVNKLLRFRMLAPAIMEAFRAGRFDFDVALAFTLTDDHDKQLSVLASFGDKAIGDWQVRQALRAQTIDATDRRARLVGREAYAAAGGRFITDLFSHDRIDEKWADEPLLQRLFDAALAKVFADLEAEGWGAVVQAGDSWGQGWRQGFDAIEPEGDDNAFTPDQMAGATALVVFDYSGNLDIKRGFVKASRSASASASASAASPSKTDPARFGFGHKGHHTMTAIATTATQAGLIAHPSVAYDALVAHLAWKALNPHSYEPALCKLAVPYSSRSGTAGQAVFDALDEFRDALPDDRAAFLPAVAALSAEDKARLLAAAFAFTLDGTQDKIVEKPGADWSDLGWMARQCEVDFAAAWTPNEAFLNGAGKPALLAVVAEVAPEHAKALETAKKGAVVSFLSQKIEATGWVPQLLRDLLAKPGVASAPKKARKAKG